MAIGSAVRSIRFEDSVGEVDVSMEVDSGATTVEQQTVADDDYEYEDIEENAHGHANGVEGDHQGKAGRKTRKSHKEGHDDVPFNRALPVAELPDDFDGEALDGATFLALSNRANASLPAFTRIPITQTEPAYIAQPVASSSRHPALPAESWMTAFPEHFRNYRSYIRAEWPPYPEVPYPDHLPPRPNAHSRGEVWLYINGHKRKMLVVNPDSTQGKGKERASADPDLEGEDAEWGIGEGDRSDSESEPEVDEEEEAMNGPKKVLVKVMEEEGERHHTHEPLISVLQKYDSHQLVSIIELITTFISETLDRLSPFVLVPSTPESSITPFPPLYARWIFACLVLLDDNLDSQDMSSIRDLARCAMKVAAWRWIQAVTDREVDASEKASWEYKGDGERDKGENGLEETLGRCWVVVHAVVTGWGQRDLLEDLDNMFR